MVCGVARSFARSATGGGHPDCEPWGVVHTWPARSHSMLHPTHVAAEGDNSSRNSNDAGLNNQHEAPSDWSAPLVQWQRTLRAHHSTLRRHNNKALLWRAPQTAHMHSATCRLTHPAQRTPLASCVCATRKLRAPPARNCVLLAPQRARMRPTHAPCPAPGLPRAFYVLHDARARGAWRLSPAGRMRSRCHLLCWCRRRSCLRRSRARCSCR
jgi:phage-related protein